MAYAYAQCMRGRHAVMIVAVSVLAAGVSLAAKTKFQSVWKAPDAAMPLKGIEWQLASASVTRVSRILQAHRPARTQDGCSSLFQ